MKKKNFLHVITFLAFVVFIVLGLGSGASTPNTNNAVIPPGLSVDIDNSAVIIGDILAVDGHRLPGMTTRKTVRVPAGRAVTILVSCARSVHVVQGNRSYNFQANQEYTLPPLENGKTYILTVLVNDDLNTRLLLTYSSIFLRDNATRESIFSQSKPFNPPIRPTVR